ncbi:MAG TPA: M20 family metallopeptidase [Candidatus Nesterenkonia stercoripullorum]|uniref:M20 family metallopeptidase n=1 Tax=Candidatus Nesterenkonia stercoripullorum TaxID=2838701 RepID=A0A9D1UV98_9MICC|nr:M20 family metallopeptidase [Candidatus Nesterenkonia stercoripullorum]
MSSQVSPEHSATTAAPRRHASGPADPLLSAAEGRLEGMLADIQRAVEIETPSSDIEAVGAGAEDLARVVAERLHAEPEVIVRDCVKHLRVRFGPGPAKVVLLNHQDTVWPVGTLARKPFSRADGVLRGPGVFDMLTGAVMSIHAVAMLAELGEPLEGLSMLITSDEEIGSPSSSELITSEAAAARAVLVMEAAAGSALKVARKGIAMYTVVVHGHAAHAGLEPEKGVNAGIALGTLLPRIAALSDEGERTTVTPTVISAGTTTNTVPARAQVAVDARAVTAEEQRRVDREIRELTTDVDGASVEVRGGINRPPMERSATWALFEDAQRVAAELGLEVPAAVEVGGGSDGNFTAGLGIPTLDGLGAVGDGAHAEHEHALIAEIAPRTALLAGLIRDQLRR